MNARHAVLALLIALASAARAQAANIEFTASFPQSLRAEPANGRLIVYLIAPDAELRPNASPAAGPFFSDPQPMYSIPLRNLAPGTEVTLADSPATTAFPGPLADLPHGTYRAQAVFDLHRLDSDWRREPGNMSTPIVEFTIPEQHDAQRQPIRVRLVAEDIVKQDDRHAFSQATGVQLISVRSAILSEFHGRDVYLRAGVALPADHNPERRYPAIYEVPGFGGNHLAILSEPRRRQRSRNPVDRELDRAAFRIVLDPESANGHHLFADSANNGPVGRALTTELIPALDAQLNLIPQPSARLLRGHSSGGWSVIWLALTYPDVFGGAWSSAPDPVDFRAFQAIDIYADDNAYTKAGQPVPSYRQGDDPAMSVREENAMEDVLGPAHTSGQQWDSWFAVFGPRGDDGNPVAFFDRATGAINRAASEKYRSADIGALLRQNPDRLAPIFRARIRIVCGEMDSYYLNRAVSLLKQDLDNILPEEKGDRGFITLIPGADHGSVLRSDAARAFAADMLRTLREAGHTPDPVSQ